MNKQIYINLVLVMGFISIFDVTANDTVDDKVVVSDDITHHYIQHKGDVDSNGCHEDGVGGYHCH